MSTRFAAKLTTEQIEGVSSGTQPGGGPSSSGASTSPSMDPCNPRAGGGGVDGGKSATDSSDASTGRSIGSSKDR